MRRPVLLLAAGFAFVLAGCGGGEIVAPLPKTVEGPLPKPTAVKGNPVAGKAVFIGQGCGSCHTFTPAGTKGTIGPDLDKLAADAQKANQGPLPDYVKTSITDPNAYVVPGFPKSVMPSTYSSSLTPTQLADLVAFLTQKS